MRHHRRPVRACAVVHCLRRRQDLFLRTTLSARLHHCQQLHQSLLVSLHHHHRHQFHHHQCRLHLRCRRCQWCSQHQPSMPPQPSLQYHQRCSPRQRLGRPLHSLCRNHQRPRQGLPTLPNPS